MSRPSAEPTAFEILMAKIQTLSDEHLMLHRDLYRLHQTNYALMESNRSLCAAVGQLYQLIQETHPQFNFGLGAVMSEVC